MLFYRNALNFGIFHCLFEKTGRIQKIQNVQNGIWSLENGKIMALSTDSNGSIQPWLASSWTMNLR